MKHLTLVVLVALATVVAGCTTPPNRVAPTSLVECGAISGEVARTEADQRAAMKKRDGAWKNINPIVVVGQYIEGKEDTDAADKRLAALDAQAAQQGCFLNNAAARATAREKG